MAREDRDQNGEGIRSGAREDGDSFYSKSKVSMEIAGGAHPVSYKKAKHINHNGYGSTKATEEVFYNGRRGRIR